MIGIKNNFRLVLTNGDIIFSRLTDIGNGYRIRHHETGKKELTPEHINYFFFRMLSFIDLCLVFLNKEEVEVDLFE